MKNKLVKAGKVIKNGKYFNIWIWDLLYPRRCPFCQSVVLWGELICEECEKELPYIEEPSCMQCGKPLPLEYDKYEYCKDCITHSHFYKRNYSLLHYKGDVKRSLYQFKYKNKREFSLWYGRKLVEKYKKEWERIGIHCIIPVPLHKTKKRQRGYNQAELLAAVIGREMGIPCLSNGLVRFTATTPQKELNNKERYLNLRKAIQVGKMEPLQRGEERKILLVDDIYTTGATMNACTSCLLQENVATEVYSCTVAIGSGFS